MSTIITDNPYTFTVSDNMNINAVFEDDARITITAAASTYVKLVNSSNQTYIWNLRSGTNTYYGTREGFAINQITSIYRFNSSTSEKDEALLTIDLSYCNNLTTIPYLAFRDCKKLTNVILPEGLQTIEGYAFNSAFDFDSSDCTINFPSSIRTISKYAFESAKLTCDIDLSQTQLTTISQFSFYYINKCRKSIKIPSTTTTLENSAFRDMIWISSFTSYATTPPSVGQYALPNAELGKYPIYVPAGSVNAYKNASGWSSHYSRIQAIP